MRADVKPGESLSDAKSDVFDRLLVPVERFQNSAFVEINFLQCGRIPHEYLQNALVNVSDAERLPDRFGQGIRDHFSQRLVAHPGRVTLPRHQMSDQRTDFSDAVFLATLGNQFAGSYWAGRGGAIIHGPIVRRSRRGSKLSYADLGGGPNRRFVGAAITTPVRLTDRYNAPPPIRKPRFARIVSMHPLRPNLLPLVGLILAVGLSSATAQTTSPNSVAVNADVDTAVTNAENRPATWSQWRGPDRDSLWGGSTWPNDFESLKLRWEASMSPSYSGPVTDGTRVFTTETVDQEFERVTAYDLQTGRPLWNQRWDGSMAVPFFAAANGSWIRSTPSLSGDSLVVFGMRDELVHLDAATGDIRWRIDFTEALKTQLPAFGAVCSPIIDDAAVYVQTGGPTVKLSLDDGSVIWQTLTGGGGRMSGGAFSSPVIATIDGVRQLVVQTRSELCGVSLDDGSVLYRQPIEAFRGMNILTPTVIGDSIFTAAHSGTAELFDVKRDGDDWTINRRWQQNIQGYMSSPVVVDDTIYLHAKNQRIIAMDVASGERLWTSTPMGKYQSMVAADGRILALDQTGELILFAADRNEFKPIAKTQVAEDAWAHLAVFEGGIIVRDLNALKVFDW